MHRARALRASSLHTFRTLLLVVVLAALQVPLPAQDLRFHIFKGEDQVGSILGSRQRIGERTVYRMTSNSEFRILWSYTVMSSVETEYLRDTLHSCRSNMVINGSMRDSSAMVRTAEKAKCYVHPDRRFDHHGPVAWTTARMYYEEPIGQHMVFVESVMAFCRLERHGPGSYRLHLPEGKVNHYRYVGGSLQEIKVERTLFDLVFLRA